MNEEKDLARVDNLASSDPGDLPQPAPTLSEVLTQDEWLRRYRQRIIVVAHASEDFADSCALAEPFEVLSEDYEDDPEGAADMEMSYWDE